MIKPVESGRDGEGGAGEDGRLVGRKKYGFLRACIITGRIDFLGGDVRYFERV